MTERKKIKPVRSEDTEVYVDMLNYAQAVGFNCVDCAGGTVALAMSCDMTECPFWHLRVNAIKSRNKALVIKPERSDAQISASKLQGEKNKERLKGRKSLDSDKE